MCFWGAHTGAVTNVAFVPCPSNLASSQPFKQAFPWQPFKRHLRSTDGNVGGVIGVRMPDREVSSQQIVSQ